MPPTIAVTKSPKRRHRYGHRQRERAAALAARNEGLAHFSVRTVLGLENKCADYDDALQTARLAIYNAALRFDDRKSVPFASWATILIHQVLWRFARVHKRHGFTRTGDSPHLREVNEPPTEPTSLNCSPPDTPTGDDLYQTVPGPDVDPAAIVARDMDAADLWRLAFDVLTDRQFKVLRYRFHDGFTYPEIAERIGATRRRAQQVAEWATVRLRRAIEGRRVGGGKEGVDE